MHMVWTLLVVSQECNVTAAGRLTVGRQRDDVGGTESLEMGLQKELYFRTK